MVDVAPLSHLNSKMDIDKILEQLLMPPPSSSPRGTRVTNSMESLRDASGSSLDRSNISSTNSSWLSDSSCSCHSMSPRSQNPKSTFVFHKQPILPPLLCSTSRSEMRLYRASAMEKEQKKKQKEKDRLISRVEAILSGVNVTPMKAKDPVSTQKHLPESRDIISNNVDAEPTDDDSTGESTDVNTVEQAGQESDDADDVIDHRDDAYRSSLRNLLQKSMNLDQDNQTSAVQSQDLGSGDAPGGISPPQVKGTSTSSSSESEDSVASSTMVNTNPQARKEAPEDNISESANSSIRDLSIQSGDLTGTSEVVKCLVAAVLKDATEELSKQIDIPLSPDSGHDDIIQEKNNVSEQIHLPSSPHNGHDDVIEEADNTHVPFENSNHQNITIRREYELSDETSVWQTPRIINEKVKDHDSPLDVSSSQFFDLHNQSTSTKVNFQVHETGRPSIGPVSTIPPTKKDIDQSPILHGTARTDDITVSNDNAIDDDVIELTGAVCYDTTNMEADEIVATRKPDISMTSSVTDDLTMLHPVSSNSDVTESTITPETQHIVTAYKEALEEAEKSSESGTHLEEEEEPLETGPISALKRSSSFTLDRPSKSFESAVIEAVSQHFHGLTGDPKKLDGHPTKDSEIAAAKKKKMHHARVRRGSYTLDEPSPYLVQNKEKHTITPGEMEDDICSLTTNGTVSDVKRRLDLPSDSEESSIAGTERKKKTERKMLKKEEKENINHGMQGFPSQGDDIVDLCRLLQDQHRNQLETMKRKHQEQLESLRQELFQGRMKMSLSPGGNGKQTPVLPPLDVTVSPSLASTEYCEIKVRREYHDEIFPREQSTLIQDATIVPNATIFDVTSVSSSEVTPPIHESLCKFSALCKGHLTRQLLRSNKVQEIMQIIRDTSRFILSMKIDETPDSLPDVSLEERLYNQLRSALYSFHDIFFSLTTAEKMYVIRQSRSAERLVAEKKGRTRQLSVATQKSIERKKLLSSTDLSPHPVNHGKAHNKDVKSKISHIWKTEPAKPMEKKASAATQSKVTSQSKKPASQKPKVTSQSSKVKSPTHTATSQNRKATSLVGKPATQNTKISKPTSPTKVTSQSGKVMSQTTKVTSQPGKAMSQTTKVTSQTSKVTSQVSKVTSQIGKVTSQTTKPANQNRKVAPQRKPSGLKKPSPLSNRVNLTARVTTA